MELEIYIPDDGSDDFVHRFRNFGEDIYRDLRDTYSVSIYEIDASTDHFRIRKIPKDKIAELTNIIMGIARLNFFDNTIELKEIYSN